MYYIYFKITFISSCVFNVILILYTHIYIYIYIKYNIRSTARYNIINIFYCISGAHTLTNTNTNTHTNTNTNTHTNTNTNTITNTKVAF